MTIRINGIEIDRERTTISHRGRTKVFRTDWRSSNNRYTKRGTSMTFDSIVHMLLSGGITKPDLYDKVYGHCRNGGPLDGPHIFDVRVHQWKSLFAHLYLRFEKSKRGGTMYYTLTPIPEAPDFNVQKTADRIRANVV